MKSQKRRRRKRQDAIVLQLLLIVAVVLIIFEGKLVVTMISHRAVMNQTPVTKEAADADQEETASAEDSASDADTPPTTAAVSDPSTPDVTLAGLTGSSTSGSAPSAEQAEKVPTVSNPDSPAIVPKSDTPVDDSYFADAVFIGDSRMEGFRNASGITQGRFFTSVGMSTSKMASEPIIATAEGNITVAAALSGGKYNKIYIMLGANDLGEYDWDSFQDRFVAATKRFQEIQPDAIFYICSCIYVEESKVTTGDYVNNANVDKINSILLQICEEQGYHYLDLNEFLSNGYGSLLENASSDGVHLYEKYCKQMLDYLKSHYVTVDPADDTAETETQG